MTDLWDALSEIDMLTKALNDKGVSETWAGLSREERMATVMKLREMYLRVGNVLEDWRNTQTSEGRE